MKFSRIAIVMSIFLCVGFALASASADPQGADVSQQVNWANTPLYFVKNAGQFDPGIKYTVNVPGFNLILRSDSVAFFVSGTDASDNPAERISVMNFIGSRRDVRIESGTLTDYKENYFLSKNPQSWRTDVPAYLDVFYRGIYKGVDVRVYGNGTQVEYDWIVAPGADPSEINYSFSDIKDVSISETGDLIMDEGRFTHKAPVAYQVIDGSKVFVEAEYVVRYGVISYKLGEYRKDLELIIDPIVIRFSTYFGGTSVEYGYDNAIDESGAVYITGRTRSTNMPVENPYQATRSGNYDVFVTKFSSNGRSLVYSTYIGGGGEDRGYGIDVDSNGYAYVAGYTASNNFPTQNAVDGTRNGTDGFVLKLSPAGNSLVFSTYHGGTNTDWVEGIVTDGQGGAYVTGRTNSTNFPTVNAYQGTRGGNYDLFLARFRADGTIRFSTYYGGNGSEYGYGVATGRNGQPVISGFTNSANFPTTANAYQQSRAGSYDAIIAKFNSTGDTLIFAGYLGGTGDDRCTGVAVDMDSNIYITGETRSSNFPMVNAYQATRSGSRDAYIAKLSSDGSQLLYSTYFGGTNNEYPMAITTYLRQPIVAGYTDSTNMPTVNAYQAARAGSYDYFILMLSDDGSQPVFATYYGGTGDDRARGIDVNNRGEIVVNGETRSTNFPLENAYDSTRNNRDDGVVKLRWDGGSNPFPVPVITVDKYGGLAPVTVKFDGSQSYDRDGEVVRYQWRLEGVAALYGVNGEYTFTEPGTYKLLLTVTDNDGLSSSSYIFLKVYGLDQIKVLLDTNGVTAIKANGEESVGVDAYILDFSGDEPELMKQKLDMDVLTSAGSFTNDLSFDGDTGIYHRELRSGAPGTATVSAYMSAQEVASVEIEFVYPRPPVNLRLELEVNRGLFVVEYIGLLKWEANPAQRTAPDAYKIYRSTNGSSLELLGEVDGTTTEYEIRGLIKGDEYDITITSVKDGEESDFAVPVHWE